MSHVALRDTLHQRYHGTGKDSSVAKFAEKQGNGTNSYYVEIRAKTVSAEAATKHAANLKAHLGNETF